MNINININKDNKIVNFGWNCDMHKKIMQLALKDVPELASQEKILTKYVQRPDFDEIGVAMQNHFYFGPSVEKKNPKNEMKKNQEGWFFTGLKENFSKKISEVISAVSNFSNAKDAYEGHIKKMVKALNKNDLRDAVEETARASHYVQDMTQPLHTQPKSKIDLVLETAKHVAFENYASSKPDQLAENYLKTAQNENSVKSSNQEDPFDNSFNSSKEFGSVLDMTDEEKDKVIQNRFNCAVENTKVLLQNLYKLMNSTKK